MEAGAPVSEEKQDHANPDCMIHCSCSHEESQLPPPKRRESSGRDDKAERISFGSAGRPEMKCSGLFNAGTGLPF